MLGGQCDIHLELSFARVTADTLVKNMMPLAAGRHLHKSLPAGTHDVYLDWLRGISALLVFFTHVRGGYFVKWGDLDPASHTYINYLLFVATRLGREAVIIFFVLSGYLVGGQAVLDFMNGRYSLRRYLIARLSRLYVVLIPVLLLTALFDSLHGVWNRAHDGLQSFLINLFFLQHIFGPPYGTNGPLWSLAYEWWFYMLFGLALLAMTRKATRTTSLSMLLILAIVLMLWLRNRYILLMFPLWLFGVGANLIPRTQTSNKAMIALSLIALCVALGISSARWDWQGDFVVGIAAGAFIYCVKDLSPLKQSWFGLGKTLAAFSFSLYALHYPLNYLLQSVLMPRRLVIAGPASWAAWAVLVIGELGVCYGFYWLCERRTPIVRAWLNKVLLPSPPLARL